MKTSLESRGSLALREERPIDINKFNPWISALLRTRGQDILRSKGILNIKGSPDRFVFQALLLKKDKNLSLRAGPTPYGRLSGLR